MGLQDLIITPLYLIVFYLGAFVLRKSATNRETYRFFIPGITIKFIGALGLGLIYQFYYGGGDTFNYWNNGKYIYDAFLNDSGQVFNLLFGDLKSPELYHYQSKIWLMKSSSAFFIVKLSGILDLFTLHTYTATSCFFAVYSFTGTWALFQLLLKKYPGNAKRLFVSLFLMPSLVIWGSGILKDSVAIGSLFWFVWAMLNWVDLKKRGVITFLILFGSAYLIYSVKLYILLCLFPCIMFFLFLKYYSSVKSLILRLIATPLVAAIFILLVIAVVTELGEEDKRYKIENIASSSRITAYDLRYGWGKEAGSGYSLGEHEGTWSGMITLAPQGVATAIYRPFIWESSNILMFIAALESLFIIVLSIRILLQRRIGRILSDPFLMFCLIFSVVFAFAVGVSTFNFGTLSRYRVPLIPFHLLVLTVNTNLPLRKQMVRRGKSLQSTLPEYR